MVNKQKRKGTDWEREAVKLLTEMIPGSQWKRVAGSGAIGTIMGEPLLSSDIVGEVTGIPKKFRLEAKTGYGGATQIAMKREWFTKNRTEAEGSYALPAVVMKFSGAQGGSRTVIGLDFEAFAEIMGFVKDLYDDNARLVGSMDKRDG